MVLFGLKRKPTTVIKVGDKLYFNRIKKTNTQPAACRNCHMNLGAWYLKPYSDLEDEKEFPCAKLVFNRQLGCSDVYFQHLVLPGEND